MVDDFMVYVDRLIASAAGFDSVNNGEGGATSIVEATATRTESGVVSVKSNGEGSSSLKKVKEMVECRICQEEDEVHTMEAPCNCNGTLKFAHRKCIQRWCNKKGNITCEICNQIFSPNYMVPLVDSSPDVMAIDIRQVWAQQIDLHDSHLLAMAAAERQFLQSDYEDFAVANSSSIACIRTVALIMLVILLLRQALMITRYSGLVQESSTLFDVSLLQFAGFLLPCYVMARSWYLVQCRRRRQG